ncbi:MAG: hypothetical protein OHK0039_38570 [Bacteroidia bacterium]
MDTTIQTQNAAVRQFNCQGCGAALEALSPRAQYVACPYCGSVLDARSETHQILSKLGNPERHPPFSFIRLGQIAHFHGRAYQVISRTRWRMKYKEYWSEEGETGYSDEVWLYDEWLLMDERRTYFYLVEDKEGYHISEEIVPETPTLLTSDLRMSFFKAQPRQIVREYGMAEAIHFEGESNYQLAVGDQIRFASMKDRSTDYLYEERLDPSTQEAKEIEFFREIPISRKQIIEAFDNNEEIERLRQREAQWTFFQRVALACALLMALLAIVAYMTPGEEVFAQTFDLTQIDAQRNLLSDPITLTEPGLYRLTMKVEEMIENQEMYLLAYILDRDRVAINTMEGEFYWYWGVDEGEKWTESNLKSTQNFRQQDSATYYVQLFMSDQYQLPGKLSVQVHRDVQLVRYYIYALIFCGLANLLGSIMKGR